MTTGEIIQLSVANLREAPWNPNRLDEVGLQRLRASLDRYGLVQNLVVRSLGDDAYEVLGGNQRLDVLRQMDIDRVPCVVVEANDAQARLLAQALNRIHGEDDLGLRAEVIREVLKGLSEDELLEVLPETADSLSQLATLGQADLAEHLEASKQAEGARLRHMTFQLTDPQRNTVAEALGLVSDGQELDAENPNKRGTALYLLAQRYLDQERPDPNHPAPVGLNQAGEVAPS